MKKNTRWMDRIKEEAARLDTPLPWSRGPARSTRKKNCAARLAAGLKASA